MKKLLIVLLFLGVIGCAHTVKAPVQQAAIGQVWCCCKADGGICCNWVYYCPGIIPGCACD